MKKNILILASAACIVAQCFTTSAIAQSKAQSKTVAFVIPISGISSKPFTATSQTITFDQAVANLYPESNITGVNITSANIESKDLSVFKSMKIYVCRKDGSNQILLGSRSISKNAGSSLFFDASKRSGGDANTITARQISPNDALPDIIARLPGVTVAGATATVRGSKSTSGSSALFVLDGITASSMPILNATNIQSVKVLKDASEVAPYGVLGANGVITITTKRGVDTSQSTGSMEDATVRLRIEYVLREELKAETGLNIVLTTAKD